MGQELPTVVLSSSHGFKWTFRILFPDLVRPLSKAERADLKASIAEHGILQPITTVTKTDFSNQNFDVVDGWNRLSIAEELGLLFDDIPLSEKEIENQSEEQLRALALSLNADRRHLSADERAELVARRRVRVVAAREEGKSIRTIAEQEGVSPSQIALDLKATESTVQGCTVDEKPAVIVGSNGRRYASRKPRNTGNDKDKDKPDVPAPSPSTDKAPPDDDDAQYKELTERFGSYRRVVRERFLSDHIKGEPIQLQGPFAKAISLRSLVKTKSKSVSENTIEIVADGKRYKLALEVEEEEFADLMPEL